MIVFLETSLGNPCLHYWWWHQKQQRYFTKKKCKWEFMCRGTHIHRRFCFITFVNCPEFKEKKICLPVKFMFVCITQYVFVSAGESTLRERGNGFRNALIIVVSSAKWSCLWFKALWCQWKVSVPAALFFQGTKYWTNSVVWKDTCVRLERFIAISERGLLWSSWKKETISLLPASCYIN